MPRYRYQCQKCEIVTIIFHTLNEEIITDCDACGAEDTLTKILSTPLIRSRLKDDDSNKNIGDLTKKFIEDNREILKNQKEETKNKTHDKT
tara:strand:- start:1398 stop:1670 length:273 start_codon:yes stop_codon:yes gene_type:complete